MTEDIGGPSGGGGGDNGGSSRNVMGVLGPPPAFLTKTFHMVNDSNIDSIISWGKLGDSFIIWDHIKFSAEILPIYFRHNNFSSFVYQLNNYGFRKIGVHHQWEYTNPYFQQGKHHLLSNMKRRSLQNPTDHRQRRKSSLSPEMLMAAIDESRQEIKKLKLQLSDTDFHIMQFRHVAKNLESTSKKLIAQWAKACEIIVERENHRGDDEKREKVGVSVEIPSGKNDEDQSEMVRENAISSPEKQAVIGNYSNELNYLTKIMLEVDDEMFEVEAAAAAGSEAGKHQAKIAQDFQELLAYPDYYLEMKME